MQPIRGFRDVFGVDLRRRQYLAYTFGKVAEAFGFEPLEVPIVENAHAYREDVVGLSPWPEWNRNGVFSLSLSNFETNYDTPASQTEAVLIPEGTLSVTRWLASKLSIERAPLDSTLLPLKCYYDISCYRNELLNTLGPLKGRQFTQFGVEVLGSESICSDLEVMSISAETLRTLGVTDAAIVFRVSSNAIYRQLAAASGMSHPTSIRLKELLDTLGECKAGKRSERLTATRADALSLIGSQQPSENLQKTWMYIMDRPPSPIGEKDYEVMGDGLHSELEYLQVVSELLRSSGLRVDIDFCVVRSHEYYTGMTFEIDLVDQHGNRAVEVGGGGRYDRLVGSFLEKHPGAVVPSVGYAFGLERLQMALVDAGHLSGIMEPISISTDLSGTLGMVEKLPANETVRQTGSRYLETVSRLRQPRQKTPISIKY